MKQFSIILFLMTLSATGLQAQTFIDKGKIEYEVKVNMKKTLGTDIWSEMMKEKIPDLKTGYYTLTFANNKSIFKFDRWQTNYPSYLTQSDEDNVWYMDLNTGMAYVQKNINGSKVNIEDSIPEIKWKLVNENRVIAGFNCRKAEAILFDSVYVFAFYTEEIIYPGGPISLHGLPGTIMGVTIPKLYTSWMATRVDVADINEKNIKPVAARKTNTYAFLRKLLSDRMKGWSDDSESDKEYKEEMARFYWSSML